MLLLGFALGCVGIGLGVVAAVVHYKTLLIPSMDEAVFSGPLTVVVEQRKREVTQGNRLALRIAMCAGISAALAVLIKFLN
jgi:hypothetical protein